MRIKKLLVLITLFLIMIILPLNNTFAVSLRGQTGDSFLIASDNIITQHYKPDYRYEDGEALFEMSQPFISILRFIALMVAVIVISIVGIKYIIGSVEEKASYKEKLIPIMIGLIFVAGLTAFVELIRRVIS